MSFLDRSKAAPLNQQFYIHGMRHGPDEENVPWSHFVFYLKRVRCSSQFKYEAESYCSSQTRTTYDPHEVGQPPYKAQVPLPSSPISPNYHAFLPSTFPPVRPSIHPSIYPPNIYWVPPMYHYSFFRCKNSTSVLLTFRLSIGFYNTQPSYWVLQYFGGILKHIMARLHYT